jgi:hypothetical protein
LLCDSPTYIMMDKLSPINLERKASRRIIT